MYELQKNQEKRDTKRRHEGNRQSKNSDKQRGQHSQKHRLRHGREGERRKLNVTSLVDCPPNLGMRPLPAPRVSESPEYVHTVLTETSMIGIRQQMFSPIFPFSFRISLSVLEGTENQSSCWYPFITMSVNTAGSRRTVSSLLASRSIPELSSLSHSCSLDCSAFGIL